MTKICPVCKNRKSEADFSLNQRECKECHKAYCKQHYLKNKAYYYEKRKQYRLKVLAWFKEYKSTLKCKCGESHPACIDFHYRDPYKKDMCVGQMIKVCPSISRLKTEIKKCVPMCRNCHAKLHYKE